MVAGGIEARRVIYSGRVQGVGFRYTTARIAQQRAVTGYVKNLRDGRVELVAEGTHEELNRLLKEIAAAMDGNIEEAEVQSVPVSARFPSFEIAY